MSLIEDALDKAEKERAGHTYPDSSKLSEIPSLSKGDRSKNRLRTIVAIVAVLCIILSLSWLGYWWFHLEPHATSRIALSTSVSPAPPPAPAISTKRETAHVSPAVSSKNKRQSLSTEQKIEKNIPAPPTNASVKSATQNSLKQPIEAHTTTVHKPHPHLVAKKTRHVSHSHSNHVKEEHYARKHAKRKSRHHITRVSPNPNSRSKTASRENMNQPSLSIRIAQRYIKEGISAYKTGDFQKAARAFETSLIYANPTPKTLAFLGTIYLKIGNYDKAYRYIKSALLKTPSDPGIQEKMGLILMAKGESSRAIPFFLRVIQAHPFWYTPHVNLGIAYRKLGNLKAARDQFLTAIKIKRDRPEAYYNLSGVYEALGDYPHAVISLEEFLKHAQLLGASERQMAKTHLNLLKSYLQKRRLDNHGK